MNRRKFITTSTMSALATVSNPYTGNKANSSETKKSIRNDDFELLINYDISDPPRWHYKAIEPDYFDWVMEQIAKNNATIFWRTNLAGRAYFHSKYMTRFDHSCVLSERCSDWHKVAAAVKLDPLAQAVRAAKKHGARIFAYMPMNEWACMRPHDLNLMDPQWWKDPSHFVRSRDGSRFFIGMPCFGDAIARERILNVIKEACDYGVDGLFLCTRSHSWYPGMGGRSTYDHMVDEFGYEDSVVEEYQNRYGVDIRHDDFEKDLWHRIKGDQYTEFLRQLRKLLGRLPIIININTERLRFMGQVYQRGGKSYRLYKDWERWVEEGLVDGICVPWTRMAPKGDVPFIEDISAFKETLPTTARLYTCAGLTYSVDKPLRHIPDRPFSSIERGVYANKSLETVRRQVQMAKEAGAAGIHMAGYMHLFADTAGKSVGRLGTLPKSEYWQALKG